MNPATSTHSNRLLKSKMSIWSTTANSVAGLTKEIEKGVSLTVNPLTLKLSLQEAQKKNHVATNSHRHEKNEKKTSSKTKKKCSEVKLKGNFSKESVPFQK